MMTYRQTIQAALTICDLNAKSKAGNDNAHTLMIAAIVAVATQGDIQGIKDANLIPVIEVAIPPSLLPSIIARFN